MGLVIGIIISLVILLLSVFAYYDIKQVYTNKNNLSLQTAKTISFVPAVKEALVKEQTSKLRALTKQLDIQNNADFIVIQDRGGVILTHPNPNEIGNKQAFDDGYKAVVFGGYYNVDSNEFLGPSITGKAPVLSNTGNVLGVVSVGYLKEKVNQSILNRMKNILYISLILLLVGFIASYLLARHIRKETMGLEPREIAELYRDRSSILSSINEGVIATTENGEITLINDSAKVLLQLSDMDLYTPINRILPKLNLDSLFENKEHITNKEMQLHNRNIIVNVAPVWNHHTFLGVVATFRDKTDITEMLYTLSEVKQYSDDLRAQTHEFSNKMYVISGLVQLGKYDDVLELIQDEMVTSDHTNKLIFEQINDFNVQAVLLGKIGKASEKKINFTIDDNSSLKPLPDHIKVSHVITILGNLIDNAFDEVMKQQERYVTFSAMDFGEDIIFEVSDNGSGIDTDNTEKIFKRGFTTKSKTTTNNYGIGLFNVKEAIYSLNGSVEIDSNETGTTMTVYIPKTRGRSND
ncbi:sensor histidine kinase [Lentibacillus kapialis]|uniref:histidine kinase n=2 Tax=Lentibacillus kapialis TaxID=340214 RepID=A0A917PYF7_9BACI|nr:sensor histidine kinase [Lentibacillus kapialis]